MEINKVYCMDAHEFLKQFPDKYADLILTDPPYGIGADKGKGTDNRKGTNYAFGKAEMRGYADNNWDNQTPNKEVFDEILRVGKKIIIFGGNFFTDKLPIGTHWLVWNKVGASKNFKDFSDAELAWTNINKKIIKQYVIIQHGFIAEEKARLYPTQKPVALFRDIIKDYTQSGEIVMDPFIGSGTTAVAAKQEGRQFIGCDNDQKYIDITNRRINNPWT